METILVLKPGISSAPAVGGDVSCAPEGGFLASFESEGPDTTEAAAPPAEAPWGLSVPTIAAIAIRMPVAEEAAFAAKGAYTSARIETGVSVEGELSADPLPATATPRPDAESNDVALWVTKSEESGTAVMRDGTAVPIAMALSQGSAPGSVQAADEVPELPRQAGGEADPSPRQQAEPIAKRLKAPVDAKTEPELSRDNAVQSPESQVAPGSDDVTSWPAPMGTTRTEAPAFEFGTGLPDFSPLKDGHATRPPTIAKASAAESPRPVESGMTSEDKSLQGGPFKPVADRDALAETALPHPPAADRRDVPSSPGVWEHAFQLHTLPARAPMSGTSVATLPELFPPALGQDQSPVKHGVSPDLAPTFATTAQIPVGRALGAVTNRPVVAINPQTWLEAEMVENLDMVEEAASFAATPISLGPAAGASGPIAAVASPLAIPLHQAVAQITAALSRSTDGATDIALAPEELGKVRLRLQPDASDPDRMVVMITFERPETLDLFRRNVGDLAEALRAAGYAGADIGFGQEGGGAGGFDQGHRPGSAPDLTDPTPPTPDSPRLAAGASLDVRL